MNIDERKIAAIMQESLNKLKECDPDQPLIMRGITITDTTTKEMAEQGLVRIVVDVDPEVTKGKEVNKRGFRIPFD